MSKNLISSSDIYDRNWKLCSLARSCALKRAKTSAEYVFYYCKEIKRAGRRSEEDSADVERKDQRMCSKSGRLNDRLGPCIVSKHHQFKDEAVCALTVDFGMLKALHHVSASNSLSTLD